LAKVPYDAGVFPSGGEAGSGFGFAEAEDESVHFCQGSADFVELRAESPGEQVGVGGIESVIDEGGSIGGEGSNDWFSQAMNNAKKK
jgi:hypothetical protein